MNSKEIAKEMIKKHEGLRLKPYRCTMGKLTIGFGRNLDDRGISLAEAEFLFEQDLEQCERELRRHLEGFSNLPAMAQAILMDMAFNLGMAGLLNFKRMLLALKEKNYELAAKEMSESHWAKQVPSRAQELIQAMRELTQEPPTLAELHAEVQALKARLVP